MEDVDFGAVMLGSSMLILFVLWMRWRHRRNDERWRAHQAAAASEAVEPEPEAEAAEPDVEGPPSTPPRTGGDEPLVVVEPAPVVEPDVPPAPQAHPVEPTEGNSPADVRAALVAFSDSIAELAAQDFDTLWDRYVRALEPIVPDAFRPPTATQARVAKALAREVGPTFSPTLAAIYQRCDALDRCAFGGEMLEIPGAATTYHGFLADEGAPPAWTPLNTDGAGNYLVVDADGHLMMVGRDFPTPVPDFASIEHLLAATTVLVEAGVWDRVFSDGPTELCFGGFPLSAMSDPGVISLTEPYVPRPRPVFPSKPTSQPFPEAF